MPDAPPDVVRAVDARIADHLAALDQELADLGPDVAPLLAELRVAVDGGKRMRAALCAWSYHAHAGGLPGGDAGGPGADAVVAAGAALELFQAAALVHDDLMDGSDTRRGRPSAHRSFEARHHEAGWDGPGHGFGTSGAVLLGDLALVASERQMTAALEGVEPTTAARARTVFDRMRTEVTVGQYLDVLGQHRPWSADPAEDEARARAVVRAKAARYSVEHPMTLGATLAGADEPALATCRRVGLPLGEAFQLRDDLLGVFGDPEVTGKPAGDDLREGKRTVLVARALAGARPADAAVLRDALGRQLTEGQVEEVRAILRRSGAVDAVEELIAELADAALAELAAAPLREPGRSRLLELARRLVDRDA